MNQHHTNSLEVILSDVVSLDVDDACSPLPFVNVPERAEYRLWASGDSPGLFCSPRSASEDDEGENEDDWEDDEDDEDDDWEDDEDADDDWEDEDEDDEDDDDDDWEDDEDADEDADEDD